MKNILRTSLLACAALAFTTGIATAPVRADGDSDMTRVAQMRLAEMGYYVGRYDGVMGPTTAGAITDFQRTHGLDTTGELNPATYDMLARNDFIRMNPDVYSTYPTRFYNDGFITSNGYFVNPDALSIWDNRWSYTRTQELPTRYGKLMIHENNRGTLRHYAMTLNGKSVMFANNQPAVMRVSRTFALKNEDAIILTTYHGDGICTYKNYLLTVHSDGTYTGPRDMGNCGGSFEAHVADNALFVSFPQTLSMTGWQSWDVWRYQHDKLTRL